MTRRLLSHVYVAGSVVIAVAALAALRAPEWCFEAALVLFVAYARESL